MRSILQGGLIVVGLMIASAEVAEAQIVTIQSSGYSAANPPARLKDTTQPNGKFRTPSYPNGNGGQWRVAVAYGVMEDGEFKVHTDETKHPAEIWTSVEHVGRGVTNKVWGVSGPQAWQIPVAADDMVRARLMRSTDNGLTWTVQK